MHHGYKCINNEALEYFKYVLHRQDSDSDKRTRQDYYRTGLRVPPLEKLK